MTLKSINPTDQTLIEEFNEFSFEQVEKIIDSSNRTFLTWRETNISARIELIQNLAKNLLDQKELLAKTITKEMGKPISEARAEIEKCALVCNYYAENSEVFLKSEIIETEAFESRVDYDPLGIVLGIMPWNYPFWQVLRFLVPSILAGNVVLLKHASNVQASALLIESLITESGFPAGVFRTLVVGSRQVESIIKNTHIKAITLTGSEKAGAAVASISGAQIKKTVLELGGSNSFIVLEDANLEKAAEIGANSRMINGGQSCIAAKRFLLHKDIAETFTSLFINKIESIIVGDPLNEHTTMGPLASEAQAIEVERQVLESVKMGAKILIGGERKGAYYLPTVLIDVLPNMPVFSEEVFGPVAPFMTIESDKEAVEIANSSEFGLGTSIMTNNLERANRLIPLFEDGAVFVNALVKSDPRLPFGGTKKSGYGRELSLLGIREFVNVKTVLINKLTD